MSLVNLSKLKIKISKIHSTFARSALSNKFDYVKILSEAPPVAIVLSLHFRRNDFILRR